MGARDRYSLGAKASSADGPLDQLDTAGDGGQPESFGPVRGERAVDGMRREGHAELGAGGPIARRAPSTQAARDRRAIEASAVGCRRTTA